MAFVHFLFQLPFVYNLKAALWAAQLQIFIAAVFYLLI